MKNVRASIRVKGRVQGVFFRQFTRETAQLHGVTGWVRNLQNGDVEAVIEGPELAVREVVSWCRKGPSAARVDELLVDWNPASGEFSGFSVR